MGRTRLRRAVAPPDAERARSIAMRGGTATLVGTACPEPVTPLVHHVRADGSAILLLGDDEPLLEHVRRANRREQAVMLELADRAPVRPAQDRPRAAVDHRVAVVARPPRRTSAMALQVAEERPHDRLLDLGYGATASGSPAARGHRRSCTSR